MCSKQIDTQEPPSLSISTPFFETYPNDCNTMMKSLVTDHPNRLILAVDRIVANCNHSHSRILSYQSYNIEHLNSWKVSIRMKRMESNLRTFLETQRNTGEYFSKIMIINHFYPLLSALNYLHKQDIPHQNIKAENILFDKDNKAYLTDCAPFTNQMGAQSRQSLNILQDSTHRHLNNSQKLEQESALRRDLKELGLLFLGMCDPFRRLLEPSEISNKATEFIGQRLLNIRTRYGKDLADLLSSMILQDPHKEITTEEILKKVEQEYRDIIVPLEDNKSENQAKENIYDIDKGQPESENVFNYSMKNNIDIDNSPTSVSSESIEKESPLPVEKLKRSDSIHTIGKGFIFLPWRYTKSSKTLCKYGGVGNKSLHMLKKCSKLGSCQSLKRVGKKVEFGGLDLLQTDTALRLPHSKNVHNNKVQLLSQCISQFLNTKEFQIGFTYDNITTKDLVALGKSFFKLKYLQKLKLSFNCGQILSDSGLTLLGFILKRIKGLEDLHISLSRWTNVTDKGFSLLSYYLSKLPKLKRLVLEIEEFPRIGEEGLENLGRSLVKLKELTDIDLTFFRCSSISGRQLSALSKHLSELKGLRKLTVNMKQVRGAMDEGVTSLAKALSNLIELKELKLNFLGSDITETGFSTLGATFGLLSQLQTLHLTFGNSDQLNNQAFNAVGTSIKKLVHLKNLKLVFFQCDKLTDVAICCLAEALSQLSLVELELNFRWCMQITDYGINKLGEAFLNLTYLNRLALSFDGCRISDAGVSKLGQDLAKLKYLDGFKLEVRECKRIQGSGISKLGECLTKLVKLGQVQLNFCGCGGSYRQRFNEGIISLRKAISRLPNVNVDQNTIAPYCES